MAEWARNIPPEIRSPRHCCLQFRPKLNLHHLHNQRQQQRRQQPLLEPGACGGATRPAVSGPCSLQTLNLNHFVQVRLPWEPGLGISHNKNQRLSQTRTETKANPNISLLSARWSIWSFSIDWRWGEPAQSTNLTWSRSHWSVLQWSLVKYYPIITGSLTTYLTSPSSLTKNIQDCKYLHLCILKSQSMFRSGMF